MSFLGSVGGVGRVGTVLLRHRLIAATGGTAAAVIVAGGLFAATSAHASGENLANAGGSKQPTKASASTAPSPKAQPLRLLSVSPAGGTHDANGGGPVTLTFSSALASATPLPTIAPKIAGSWQVSGATATFTPSSGFQPDTKVTLAIPGGMTGAAASAGTLKQSSRVTFTTGSYSTLGLQQLLTQLGYLPFTWTAKSGAVISPQNADAELAAAYHAPAGTFSWNGDYPSNLTDQWTAGSANILDTGAIRAFESVQGLTMDGYAGQTVWSDLLTAVAKGKDNPNGYTYALANQHYPESLTLWHNGRVVLTTPVNTGIPGRSTVDGTFPVYLKFYFTYMDGTNPDGSKYHDPVYYANYFNGGDAVHEFQRYSYGFYQSLGCVELPWDAAKTAYGYLSYGSLVTVTGPVA